MPQTDDSESSSTLPRPDLNPMLNPILGENLGRWAEVYFTSPADTREQAVQELLLELEAQQAAEGSVSVSEAPLAGHGLDGPKRAAINEPFPAADTALLQIWRPEEPSGDRAAKKGLSLGIWYSRVETALRRHYLYAGIAFAILGVLTLAYTVWRNAPATSGSSLPAQVRSAATGPPANSPPQQEALVRESLVREPRQGDAQNTGQVTARPDAAGPANTPEKPWPSPIVTTAAGRSAIVPRKPFPTAATSGTGFEELAMAKNYLNGSGERNTAEAATWLWKAVAKQNAEATELLATLYLEGDGVPKNCDQARLLLDAAARKGIRPAAERLGHLQAFGCE